MLLSLINFLCETKLIILKKYSSFPPFAVTFSVMFVLS